MAGERDSTGYSINNLNQVAGLQSIRTPYFTGTGFNIESKLAIWEGSSISLIPDYKDFLSTAHGFKINDLSQILFQYYDKDGSRFGVWSKIGNTVNYLANESPG